MENLLELLNYMQSGDNDDNLGAEGWWQLSIINEPVITRDVILKFCS